MFLSKSLLVVRYAHPMLSDSSIRRLKRQRNISQRYRNQNAGLNRPMSAARLALGGRHRFPIGLSFFKHPEAGLGEVAGHGHFSFTMPPAAFNALIKTADVPVAAALGVEHRAVGCSTKAHFRYTLTSRRTAPKRILPPLEFSRATSPQ
jgi:hypothetical protein